MSVTLEVSKFETSSVVKAVAPNILFILVTLLVLNLETSNLVTLAP